MSKRRVEKALTGAALLFAALGDPTRLALLQRLVAKGLTMRQAPELRFDIDEALKRAKRTMELLEENRRQRPEVFGVPGEAAQVETEEEEDDDLLEPDDDEFDDDDLEDDGDDAQPRRGSS